MQEDFTVDVKPTGDLSEAVTEVFQKAADLFKAGRIEESYNEIMAVEKKARQAGDAFSVARIAKYLLNQYKESNDWDTLLETITFLSKRRGQLKKPIIEVCGQILLWVTPGSEQELKLPFDTVDKILKTMTELTEGKLFVEAERARFIRIKADRLEAAGNISEAANLLANVQAEAFSGMELREKMEYIINQMRVVLLNNDFIRCQIISKKIYPRNIDLPEMKDLKLQYNRLTSEYHLYQKDYMELAKCAYRIFTILYEENPVMDEERRDALGSYILFLLLAPFDNEQVDLLNRILVSEKKPLVHIPVAKEIIQASTTDDIIDWPPPCVSEFEKLKVVTKNPNGGFIPLLQKRLLQHNLRVVSTFYKNVEIARVAQLLNVAAEDVEENICEMIHGKFFYAKIDRPSGVVEFGKLNTAERLNESRGNFMKALRMLDETTLLIRKERMMKDASAKLKA